MNLYYNFRIRWNEKCPEAISVKTIRLFFFSKNQVLKTTLFTRQTAFINENEKLLNGIPNRRIILRNVKINRFDLFS